MGRDGGASGLCFLLLERHGRRKTNLQQNEEGNSETVRWATVRTGPHQAGGKAPEARRVTRALLLFPPSQARKWGPVSSVTTSRYHSDWADLGLEPGFFPPHWGWQTVHWLAPTSLSGCGEPCTESPEAVLGLSGDAHGD